MNDVVDVVARERISRPRHPRTSLAESKESKDDLVARDDIAYAGSVGARVRRLVVGTLAAAVLSCGCGVEHDAADVIISGGARDAVDSGTMRVMGGAGGSMAAGGTGGAEAQGGSADDGCICTGREKPGGACSSSCERCWGKHCGVAGNLLACVDGAWELQGHVEGTGTAWDFKCAPEEEGVYGISEITQGQCCGERVPSTPDPLECRHCPAMAPVDGSVCSLPAECGEAASPAVIDCFYFCCCYGNVTWAQCDGQRWHVATDCSSK